MLGRRRHVGDEGAALRDGPQVRPEAARGIEGAEAAVVVTDCPLSAQRILKENDVAALHPAEALARAYGLKLEV